MKNYHIQGIQGFLTVVAFSAAVLAQTTAFNFQGRLNDGTTPANGRYDVQFKLFDAVTGGNQISSTVGRPNTMLVNGVFSTTLDFGATVFSGDRFLEISVRPLNSPNGYVILGARQQILSVPLAVRSTTATSATFADNAGNAQTAVNATNALSLGGVPASGYARLAFLNDGNVRQSSSSNGLVKAMIYVDIFGDVVRCYNGIDGSTGGKCGFDVTRPSGFNGVTRIDFHFNVTDRFVSVAGKYASSGITGANNIGANFTFFNSTTVEVFTFHSGNSADTINASFILIMF